MNAPTTRTAVDILFAVSALVSILKAGDLLLRPHQQKWLQARIEHLALWLSYRRPFEWYHKAGHPILLRALSLLATFSVGAVYHEPVARAVSTAVSEHEGAFLGACVFALFTVRRASKMGSEVLNGIASRQEPEQSGGRLVRGVLGPLLRSSLFFLVAFTLVGALFYAVCLILFRHQVVFDPRLVIIAGFAAIGWPVEFVTLWLTAMLIVSAALILGIGGLLLRLVEAVTWRVAEHNKGAYAAMVLLATAMLGILDGYLRLKPK